MKLHYGKEEIVGRGEEERGGEDVVVGRRGGREEAMVGRGNVVVATRGGGKKNNGFLQKNLQLNFFLQINQRNQKPTWPRGKC